MPITVQKLTKTEVLTMLEKAKVSNRMPKDLMEKLKEHGWTFDEYAMDKKVKGLTISLEFCIGDYCVGVYSKRGKWLLENKVRCDSFPEALVQAKIYEQTITSGKHWKGELD